MAAGRRFWSLGASDLGLGFVRQEGLRDQDRRVRIDDGRTGDLRDVDHRGIEMAIEEANAAGGVGGTPIRLITEDDQGKPEEAATAVNKLISQDR